MTIGLVMVVKDEATRLERLVPSLDGLIDHWTIIDTGSSDNTPTVARDLLADVPGTLHGRPWRDFGSNLTEAVGLAAGSARWLLRLDADMTVSNLHPGFRDWLDDGLSPDAEALSVEILESGQVYRLPLLMRGDLKWRYIGRTHEYLDTSERRLLPVIGLTVTHHHDGASRSVKHQRDLDLLAADAAAGDPRAVFYSAQALECLGRTEEAIALYSMRARMGDFEEEAWLAQIKAADLAEDVEGLIEGWRRRPQRHEPLAWAARIVRSRVGAEADVLLRDL